MRGALEDGGEALVGGCELGEEALARRRQRHAPARAVDEAHTELVLERAQALADA